MEMLLLLVIISFASGQSLTSSDSVVKKPGESVTLSCTGSGFSVGSSYMHWVYQKPGNGLEWIGRIDPGTGTIFAQSLQGQFSIKKDSSKNMLYLEIKSLKTEDTAVYYCAGEHCTNHCVYYFDYWGKGTKVTVSSVQPSAPKSIFGMSQCTSDSDGFLTIGCLARGFSPADSLTFKWKDSDKKELSGFVQYPAFGRDGDYSKISHLRVRKSDWDAKKPYKCEASNSEGSKETTLVPSPPPPDQHADVYLTVPTKMELDNGTATFMCLAQRFSPKTYAFKWYQDGKEVTDAIDKYDKSEKKGSVTEYSATSILQISADKWNHPNNKIKCEFVHKTGKKVIVAEYAVPIQDCTNIAVDIVPPSLEDMLKNRQGVLKCKASADNSGFTKIKIEANNNIIAEAAITENKKVVELDAPIGYEEWSNGTEFTCTVEHKELAEPKATKFIRENGKEPKRPSVYILAPPEHKEGDKMTLTCYVKDFYPKEVFVSWLADDEPVTLGYSYNTSLPIHNDKYFSVYSQLTVDHSEWKSGTVFSCIVYHESIDEKMRVLTRSIDDNIDKAGVINLSMNTPASCKD
uniref:Ig-like domain-containing protein n=1 Tax=Cyprinus carpio TaxID=7962 RepID=A0A8C2J4A2_CYPCA